MPKPQSTPDPVAEFRLHLTLHWTSQAEFCRAAGVSQVALTNYLVGRRGFSPRVASAVAKTVARKEAKSRLTLERLLGLA